MKDPLEPGPEDVAARAALLLRDLAVLARRAAPADRRPAFRWLGPGYGRDVYRPAPERLVAGFETLPDDQRELMAEAMAEAVETASVHWLGAQVTLDLVDWVQACVPQVLSPRRLARLLHHHDAGNAAESAFWLRSYTRRLMNWGISLPPIGDKMRDLGEDAWRALLRRAPYDDQVDVAVCLMTLMRPSRPDVVDVLYEEAIEAVDSRLPGLPAGCADYLDDIERPLSMAAGMFSAARSGVARSEAMFQHSVLARYVADADEAWPADQRETA